MTLNVFNKCKFLYNILRPFSLNLHFWEKTWSVRQSWKFWKIYFITWRYFEFFRNSEKVDEHDRRKFVPVDEPSESGELQPRRGRALPGPGKIKPLNTHAVKAIGRKNDFFIKLDRQIAFIFFLYYPQLHFYTFYWNQIFWKIITCLEQILFSTPIAIFLHIFDRLNF